MRGDLTRRNYPNGGARRRAPVLPDTLRRSMQRIENAPQPKLRGTVNTPAGRLPIESVTHSGFRGWVYTFYVESLAQDIRVNGVKVAGSLPFSGRMSWSESELLPLQMTVSAPTTIYLPAPKSAEPLRPAANQLAWFIQQGAIK